MSASSASATATSKFQEAFIEAKPEDRFSLILRAKNLNPDNRIDNLLSGLNVNDTLFRNSYKADNIYFVCHHLRAFPNFIFS